ncbi:ferredoxin-type protein NapF [Chitinibacter sp. SCUT-21]|uniref:ferredoxin-type protein NapF n=1 Tax=Chitinibacter sp. SCUT-21 TaxID=2970891 RepID=UPI0035A5A60F
MSVDLSRRSLLFGRKPAQEPVNVFRPPWANERFTDICTRCAECITVCPSQVIVKGDAGFPEIDYKYGECTFCGECRDVCQPKALSAEDPWHRHVQIGAQCIAYSGVDCRVCGEVCDTAAIKFALQVGTVAQPQLNIDACTGCGACMTSCPTAAIQMLQAK